MNQGKVIYPPTLKDWGLLIIRLMLAWVFIYHGSQKLFGAFGGMGMVGFEHFLASVGAPMPKVSAYLSALTEFCGGIVLLLGTGTRLVAIPMCINMGMAVWVMHRYGFSGVHDQGGYEYPLELGVVIFGLLVAGPGRLTLGALLRGARLGGGQTPTSQSAR